MRQYLVIYGRAEDGGWGAYVPDLPGCFTLGDSRYEAERRIREAVAAHLDLLQKRGEPIPAASSVAAEVIEVPS